MLSDPMSVPSGFPLGTSIPAVSREANKSVYQTVSGGKTVQVTVSHQDTKNRRRSLVRVDVTDIASDPLVPANSKPRSVSAYTVFDYEPGFSAGADVSNAAKQLFGCLGLVGSFANLTTTILDRIVAGES